MLLSLTDYLQDAFTFINVQIFACHVEEYLVLVTVFLSKSLSDFQLKNYINKRNVYNENPFTRTRNYGCQYGTHNNFRLLT